MLYVIEIPRELQVEPELRFHAEEALESERRDTGHGAPTRAPLRHGSAVLAQPAARVGSLSRTAFAGRETHPQDSAYYAPGEGDTLASVSAGPKGAIRQC